MAPRSNFGIDLRSRYFFEMKCGNEGSMIGVTVGMIIYCASMISNNIWLTMWTDDSALPHPEDKVTLRLSVYGALGFGLGKCTSYFIQQSCNGFVAK